MHYEEELAPVCHVTVGARSEETRRAFNIALLKHDMEYRGRKTHDINNIEHQTWEKLRLKNTEESHEEN